jgi:DNA-binding MarR family transcriptional regulator
LAKRAAKPASRRPAIKGKQPPGNGASGLKGLDNLIGYRLRLAYNAQVQRFASVGGAYDIRPPQFAILKLAYFNPKLRQTELTAAVNKKHANVVSLLDELEGRKLLSRVPDRRDKRSRVLHLTPKGKRLTAKLLERHARLERNLRQTFGGPELDQLTELLEAFSRLDPAPDIDGAE